jgi:hypothetical protein
MSLFTRFTIGAGLLSGLFALVSPHGNADPKPNNDKALPAWVQKRVQAWQPTDDERRIDQIAWAKDLRAAQKLAKENNRPVFLFSYSGSAVRENAIALERC